MMTAGYFMDDDQAFMTIHIQRKSGAGAQPQGRMALFYGPFNILRVMISASNDDQVFEAAGDEKFAVFEKDQIAGAQKRPVVGIAQLGLESICGLRRTIPIALRDAWS